MAKPGKKGFVTPVDMFAEENPRLRPLPPLEGDHPHPYDIAHICQVRASSQFRLTLDTNRYSAPAMSAAMTVTWILSAPITPKHCWLRGKKPGTRKYRPAF